MRQDVRALLSGIALLLLLLGIGLLVISALDKLNPYYAAEGGVVIAWAVAGLFWIPAQARQSKRALPLLLIVVALMALFVIISTFSSSHLFLR